MKFFDFILSFIIEYYRISRNTLYYKRLIK